MPVLTLKLLVAHLLGDYVLQSDADARAKHRAPVLAKHVLLHALALGLVALSEPPALGLWLALLGVLLAHALIDGFTSRRPEPAGRRLALDQAGHLAVILVAVGCVRPQELAALAGLTRTHLAAPATWVYAGGMIAAVALGGVLVGIAVRPFARAIEEKHGERVGLERAGRWIGWLERALVFVALQSGIEPLIGFVIAAKALLRLPEAREPRGRALAEYYLIGSLASIAWAVFVGLATRAVLRHLGTAAG